MATGADGLRVVHVVLSLENGGLEHVVVNLVRGGRDWGQNVSVVCLERPGVLASQLESNGFDVRCLDKPSGLQRAAMRRKLQSLFEEWRPDVVHTHQIGALFYAGPAARAGGVSAVVHTEHGKHFGGRAKTRWLGRIAALSADRFFCVSNDIANEAIRCRITPPYKVAVVPNGIDTARFGKAVDVRRVKQELGIPIESPVVGTVGRLAEVKRQDLLVRIFARLLKDVPAAHLLIVGDGPQRSVLERLATDLGVRDRTFFAGYREDRERLLQVMDVFTLTSRSEGMPLALLEAWAAGVPVVVARVGGLPELVDDGRTGILVEGDDVDAWASSYASLLRRTDLKEQMGAAGKACAVERYGCDVMIKEYESRYRDVLGGRRGYPTLSHRESSSQDGPASNGNVQ